eukprot:g2033.t1
MDDEKAWTILFTAACVVAQVVMFLWYRGGRKDHGGSGVADQFETQLLKPQPLKPQQPPKGRPSSSRRSSRGATSVASKPPTRKQVECAPLPMHPTFPSISLCEIMSGSPMFPNSRKPIPFRTDLFEGQALFMLVSNPPDPFFAEHFDGRKRRMELHFQGKFLRKPQGTLYIGGEIEEKMNIGVMLRTMAGMMLRLVKSLSYGKFHHSFGSSREKEKPHIVTSFYNGVDAFVATPPGEEPPPLGRDLPESKEDRAFRRKAPVGTLQIDTDLTYSFSFHSMYVDLLNWQIVKIPGFKPVDLHSYWGSLPLYIALYDLRDNSGDYHSEDRKRYFWKFRFSHTPINETEIGGSGDSGSGVNVVFPPHLLVNSDDSSASRVADADTQLIVPQGLDCDYESDESDNHSSLIRRRSSSATDVNSAPSDHTMGLVVDVPAFIECAAENSYDKIAMFIIRIGAVNAADEGSALRDESCLLCTTNDLLDLASFAVGESGVRMQKLCRRIKGIRLKSSNLPQLESKRRTLDSLLVGMSSDRSQSKLLNVLVGGWGSEGESTTHILSFYRVHSVRPLLSLQSGDILAVTLLSQLGRAEVGSKVGVVEATERQIANADDGKDLPLPRHLRFGFEVHTYGRVFTFAVASTDVADEWVAILSSMIQKRNSASARSSNDSNYMTPKTKSRDKVYKSTGSSIEQSSPNWIRVGENRMAESLNYDDDRTRVNGEDVTRARSSSIQISLDPRALFVGNSCHWASPSRTVLNARRLSFASDIRSRRRRRMECASTTPNTSVSSVQFACKLSSSILEMALQLRPDSSISTWSRFMDRVALLKDVDLSATSPDSMERQIFWINVYHTLVIHTRLLLGAPNSAYGFFKRAKHVSYEIFAVPYRDVYSLLEIEHCVLRGGGSKPKASIAGFFLPSRSTEQGKEDVKWDMAPSVSDPRINFILNYATVSSLREIPVFSADSHEPDLDPGAFIDRQFDVASAIYLQHFAVIDVDSRTVVLPKVLDWYRGDFGKTQPSHRGVLLEVHRLLEGGIKGSKLSILLQGDDAPWMRGVAGSDGSADNSLDRSQQRQLVFSQAADA